MKRLKFILLFILLLIKEGLFFNTVFSKTCYSGNWFHLIRSLSPARFTIPMDVETIFDGDLHKWSIFDNKWMKVLERYGVN